jgi:hypothetical protein
MRLASLSPRAVGGRPLCLGRAGRWEAGRSALQRRIVAPLIVEREARPLGGVVVESSGDLPVAEGRSWLRMRFAPKTTLPIGSA